ncbi:hypothetical protein B0T42_14915 [Rathayibacter sp. VKM Ac-2630]|nr:hypothetical protein B0T42_14915 [Rathayibacter sp. VKM Ac-2630]
MESMAADDTATTEDDAVSMDDLVEALALIEDQPLSSRASSYTDVQDQLRARLEGADVRR